MAEGLDDGGVVGKGLAVGLLVGAQEEGELEGLRRLDEAKKGAVNSAGRGGGNVGGKTAERTN